MWEPNPEHKQELIEKHKNRVPLKDLSKQYDTSVEKIRAFLTRENQWIPYKNGRANLPEQQVISLYKQDWTKEQIAEKFNVSVGPVVSILDKHSIRKPKWAKNLPYFKYEQISDKEFFSSVVNKCISKQQVAEYLDLNYDMVASLYKRHNIEGPQSSGDVRSLLNRRKRDAIPFTQEEFEKQHFKYNKSIQEIARLMGISTNYLRLHLKKWGVSTRDTRISLEFRAFKKLSTEEIKEAVHNTLITKLHKELKVSVDVLSKFLRERNVAIPQRFVSQGEKIIGEFVESRNIKIERNNRTLIHPYEIDIYIPSHNLAIEYCGLYWHSELNNRGKNYHVNKLNKCTKKGIRLLTIFEDEYIDHPEIVESKILSILHVNNLPKINARQCAVKEISSKEKKNFLNNNHLQGNDVSSVKLGLFYNDKLVSVMTFAKPSRVRSSKKHQHVEGLWELNRFATDNMYNVRGAAGKLLSYFKKHYNWNKIYSYADKRWSNGNLYNKLGFRQVIDSPPNYWYVPRGYYKRIYRYNFTKYKLVEQGFNPEQTEQQIMKDRGYTRIWDCGHLKFELDNDQ